MGGVGDDGAVAACLCLLASLNSGCPGEAGKDLPPDVWWPRMDASTANKTPLSSSRGFFSRVAGLCLLTLITCYQGMIRPFLIGSCKFCPTCSEYAAEAIRLHGPWRGLRLTVGRLMRCRPFSAGGIDPVPGLVEPDSDTGAACE